MITDVEFGILTEKIIEMSDKVDKLVEKLETQDRRSTLGRGVIIGGMIVAAMVGGSTGAAVLKILQGFLG